MRPSAPPSLLGRAARWDHLSQWERAELGRALRRLGWSYGEIMEVLPVAKGTLAGWCREVRISPQQRAAIAARTRRPVDTQRKRREEIQDIRAQARADATTLAREPLWVAGTALYWAEGAKSKRSLELTNSDPRLLRLFIRWVRTYHDPDARFVLHLHLHDGGAEEEARAYWRTHLGLPHAEFHKSFVKPPGTGQRKNRLPHGVCRVRLRRGTDAWERTMAWIDVLGDALPESSLKG